MAYASVSPTIDPIYGQLDGYALVSSPHLPVGRPTPAPTPGPSGVVVVPCNVNIEFLNFDKTSIHTASLLNPPNGPFPRFFNNPNGLTPSMPLTPISFNSFSTGGVLNDSGSPTASAVYATGSAPGAYYFGDYVDYNVAPSMRTVIIVSGC